MTDEIHKILKDYWGFDRFRPLQEDIILSALADKDTLALLPTGGGKSVCFQVPVMARKGIGIVVSPLIALMADQVKNLKKLGIPAIALTSGLSYRELDLGLDNCVNGHYKFLYLSPERLKSDLVRQRIKRMKVNLLVVDEAHCISQWGYDFRPPYTQIAEVRELMPQTPVMALTATATPKVVDDIMDKLQFEAKNLIKKSFYRPNLFYNVNHTEKKWSKTLQILHRIGGSGIIYMRNRKHCVEVARWLQQNGISADYYHAGLSSADRKVKQDNWLKNQKRMMVSTNAFGMGIDKPDVRLVMHLDLPDSLEAYFQEAGRAGRDGQKAFSVVLVGPSDVRELHGKYLKNFPDLEFIKRLYQALTNYFQLATGAGEGQSFSFDLGDFCRQYELPIMKSYQALNILEREGLIGLTENFRQPSRVMITVGRTDLYDFQLRNPRLDSFIKTLSRSYGGLDVEYTSINELQIARRLGVTEPVVRKTLLHLKKQGILDYVERKGDTQISFHQERQPVKYLSISDDHLKHRYEDRKARIKSVEDFVNDSSVCRSISLLRYFGEKTEQECGFCDVCRRKKATGLESEEFESLKSSLLELLHAEGGITHQQAIDKLRQKEEKVVSLIQWLTEEGIISQSGGFIEVRD